MSRNVRPFHPSLHVARAGRALPAYAARREPAGALQLAPTDAVDVVAARDGKVELAPMRWGLVPWWWKNPMKELPSTFNARAETVVTNRCSAMPSSARDA